MGSMDTEETETGRNDSRCPSALTLIQTEGKLMIRYTAGCLSNGPVQEPVVIRRKPCI